MGWSRRDETKRRGADEIPQDIDITIDGADEVDPSLNLIKGGGALLREKIVAQAIRWQMIVVDQRKLHPRLANIGHCRWKSSNLIGACRCGSSISSMRRLCRECAMNGLFHTDQGVGARAGIVEHGLFIGIAHGLFVAGANGVAHPAQ
jgi:ribose 5-phosphate isomerase A